MEDRALGRKGFNYRHRKPEPPHNPLIGTLKETKGTTMTIIDYTEPAKVNPYDETVKSLIEAGDGKAVELTVSNAELGKVKLQFAKAANDQDKTARKRVEEIVTPDTAEGEKDGTTRLVYTLTVKHAPRTRKGKDGKDVAPESAPEVEAEASSKGGKAPATK